MAKETIKYRILQINKHDGDAHFIKFSSIRDLRAFKLTDKVTLDMYGKVYEGETEKVKGWQDELYKKFQGLKPEGYTGHSLSVSDIIESDGRYYYCDSFGWREVTVRDGKIDFSKK